MDTMVFKVSSIESRLIPEVIVVLLVDVPNNGLPAVSEERTGQLLTQKKHLSACMCVYYRVISLTHCLTTAYKNWKNRHNRHAHMHMHTRTHTRAHTHTRTHTHTHTHTHALAHTHTHTCARTRTSHCC